MTRETILPKLPKKQLHNKLQTRTKEPRVVRDGFYSTRKYEYASCYLPYFNTLRSNLGNYWPNCWTTTRDPYASKPKKLKTENMKLPNIIQDKSRFKTVFFTSKPKYSERLLTNSTTTKPLAKPGFSTINPKSDALVGTTFKFKYSEYYR